MEDEKKIGYADDFPSSANEPVFEALPDYRLATDETPLFETGENKLSTEHPEDLLFSETTLDEKTLNELEAFIARARELKGTTAPVDGFKPVSPKQSANKQAGPSPSPRPSVSPKPAAAPKEVLSSRPRQISFEVDFGDGRVEEVKTTTNTTTKRVAVSDGPQEVALAVKPSFEFAFSAAPDVTEPPYGSATSVQSSSETATEEKPVVAAEEAVANALGTTRQHPRKTKSCPDCQTELPKAARFCFSCGYPQPEAEDLPIAGAKAPEEDVLVLDDLPTGPNANEALQNDQKEAVSSFSTTAPSANSSLGDLLADVENGDAKVKTQKAAHASGAISTKKYTMAELKQTFREHFQDRVIAYFGVPKLKKYYATLEQSSSFQQLRDGSLTNLLNWINGGERTYSAVARRTNDTMADLTEYFIVEIAGELSGKVLPQKLLRHQSVNWETVDLFKLVTDYLDFEGETERVYTDFVSMPARALRNATKAFLNAGKDERIFFICDQSLISQAKNGFAVTDAGIYWKNVLQPAGNALFTTMNEVCIEGGHLSIDGQFFNAGARLNLKMAILLDKLRRMEVR